MIPYFKFTIIPIGPINIQVWGLFVVIGILSALVVGRRLAVKRGLDKEVFTDLAAWSVMGGLIGARLFHAFAYESSEFLADPAAVLRIWEGGMSMFGGLIGGFFGLGIFAKRHATDVAAYANVAAFVLPLGYAIARLGCFFIHDHPGVLSGSALAVGFPEGARLDLGLLQSAVGFIIFAVFVWLEARKPRLNYLALFMVCYGSARLVSDFFRATDLVGSDVRFAGLTPAQYVSLIFIVIGTAALMRSRPRLHAIFP